MLRGKSVSGGVAVGRAVVIRTEQGWLARVPVEADRIDRECGRLREAAEAASRMLQALSREKSRTIGGEISAILAAHALIASDPAFLESIEKLIRRERVNAEWALRATAEEFRRRLAESADPNFSARGDDVVEVARSIEAELSARGGSDFDFTSVKEGAVLVADDLSPAQAARLDPRQFSGLALERGGPHSHAAIIARSFGIPAVVGVAGLLAATARQRPIIVDGDRATVEARPTKDQLRRALERVGRRAREEREFSRRPAAPVSTADGVRLILRANLELPEESSALGRFGAEGVGLFRSEFLYIRSSPLAPSVEQQREWYEHLLEVAAPHPVVVRTYDLGGEKDFSAAGRKSSPLGLRGLRYSLGEPEMFRQQLRALLQASRRGDLRILLPMVSTPAEVIEARAHLKEIAQQEGVAQLPPVGIMIEVPSAVLLAGALSRVCDFFSVGTNDLAQYLLAADRNDPAVSNYYRPVSPPVLKMIKCVVDAAAEKGLPLAVCGELAGDPVGIAALIGLGVREFSMSPVLLPRLRDLLARLEADKLAGLATLAMNFTEASEVEELFSTALKRF